jgi:hypothetical protein
VKPCPFASVKTRISSSGTATQSAATGSDGSGVGTGVAWARAAASRAVIIAVRLPECRASRNRLRRSQTRSSRRVPEQCGAVAEWSKALAWKVSIRQKRIEGSNPSRSAKVPVQGRSPCLKSAVFLGFLAIRRFIAHLCVPT